MHTRGFVVPEVEDAYRRVRTLCGTAGDSPQRFAALWGLRIFHLLRGELVAGRVVAQEFLDLVQRTGMSSLAAEAHLGLGTPLFFLGEFAAAQPHLEQALTLYNPQLPQPKVFLIGQDPRTSSLAHLAVLLWIIGCPDQARERCRQALALETAFPYSRALTLNLVATLFVCCRDFQAVAQHAEAARVFAQECGFVHLMAMGMVLQGWAFVMQGKGEEGLALMQTGLTRQHAVGIGIGEVSYQLLLVEAYTRLGQREAALQTLATTFTAIESTGERTYEAEVYRLQGELKLQQESREHRAGNTEQRIRNQKQGIRSKEQKLVLTDRRFPTLASQNEAEACFYQAITIAQRQQAKSLELRASTSLARLWQQQGRKKEAHKMLSEIYHWFTEGFDTPDLQVAQALLKELA